MDVKSVDVVDGKLEIRAKDTLDVQQICDEALQLNRTKVLEFFQTSFPDIDFDTYEGGIDTWFGAGSVTMFELGLKLRLELEAHNSVLYFY